MKNWVSLGHDDSQGAPTRYSPEKNIAVFRGESFRFSPGKQAFA